MLVVNVGFLKIGCFCIWAAKVKEKSVFPVFRNDFSGSLIEIPIFAIG